MPLAARLARQFGRGDATQLQHQLLPFCREYIAQVPVLTAALTATGKEFRLSPLFDSYLALSTQYLLSACDEIETGTDAVGIEQFLILLQGAYIFSRMLEELDDKTQVFIGIPLNHVNLMDANLMIHEIIGDTFANRLDKVVASLVKQSKVSKGLIEANLDKNLVAAARQSHLSLTGLPIENFAEKHGLDLLSGLT